MDVIKVVVHALDHQMKTIVLSAKQINLNQGDAVDSLVLRLTKSLQNSTATSNAHLKETSFLSSYVGQPFDFMAVSQQIAKSWFDLREASTLYTSCNLVFAMVDCEDTIVFTMFEVMSRPGYISVVEDDETAIEFQGRVLSESFTGIKHAFLMDLNTGDVSVKTTLKEQPLLEEVFECDIYLNAKNSVTLLTTVVDAVSVQKKQAPLMNTIKAKQLIEENAALFDEIAPKELIEQVFESLDESDVTLINDAFEANHVEPFLQSKQVQRLRSTKTHTIVTDSGVEIKIPLDSVDVNAVLDIEEDERGFVTIHLKNIGKIV